MTDPLARKHEAAALADRYLYGATIRELAEQTGRSYGMVRSLLIEAGVTFRPRGGSARRSMRATPLFIQIADRFAVKIKSGRLKEYDKLPSESELMRRYDVSVGTVRAAMRRLR